MKQILYLYFLSVFGLIHEYAHMNYAQDRSNHLLTTKTPLRLRLFECYIYSIYLPIHLELSFKSMHMLRTVIYCLIPDEEGGICGR